MLPLLANAPRISFLAFFLLWAERMRWEVPALHVRVCMWLEQAWLSGDELLLLMLPRGHAKSTILEIFNAWLYYNWPTLRILHQSESDPTALRTSRGTKNVMMRHPLTVALMAGARGEIESWWLAPAYEHDPRNGSMFAKGILSNVTSARADFVQNDDVEVPRNITKPEMREKMRYRLGEQVHISVPGAPQLFIGTPHTHESIYDDVRKLGANCMVVRMFEQAFRIEKADRERYEVEFAPEFVFSGIGKSSRLLQPGTDYRLEGDVLVLAAPGGELIDCYSGAVWPERFGRDELQKRRRKTRTLNEWDSQYQLHSKPVTQVRLDPTRIIPYDVQPRLVEANGATSMFLGKAQIVGAALQWDPSSGKIRSDVSAVAVVFQDESGRRYLHHVEALTGEVAEFAADGKTLTGGQVWQLCSIVERWGLPLVTIETNGIGKFAPAVLRAALKQRKLFNVGVREKTAEGNKNKRILGTFEPLLLSRGMLWAHVDVLRGPFATQMRDWNPAVVEQEDDYIDAAEGAISEQPERFKGKFGITQDAPGKDWRPTAGAVEVAFER